MWRGIFAFVFLGIAVVESYDKKYTFDLNLFSQIGIDLFPIPHTTTRREIDVDDILSFFSIFRRFLKS